MKVKATSTGYYNHMLRVPGSPKGLDVFDIQNEKEFAWEWMEPVGWTPKIPRPGNLDDSVTGEKKSAVQVLNEKTDAMLSAEVKPVVAPVAVAPVVAPAPVVVPVAAVAPAPTAPVAAPKPL